MAASRDCTVTLDRLTYAGCGRGGAAGAATEGLLWLRGIPTHLAVREVPCSIPAIRVRLFCLFVFDCFFRGCE